MRVNAPVSFPQGLPPDKIGRSGSTAQQNRSTPANSGEDQARLSVNNNTMQQLMSGLSRVPEVRQERVDALRQAVNGGSYQVSDQQLSNAIASDLLGTVIG